MKRALALGALLALTACGSNEGDGDSGSAKAPPLSDEALCQVLFEASDPVGRAVRMLKRPDVRVSDAEHAHQYADEISEAAGRGGGSLAAHLDVLAGELEEYAGQIESGTVDWDAGDFKASAYEVAATCGA